MLCISTCAAWFSASVRLNAPKGACDKLLSNMTLVAEPKYATHAQVVRLVRKFARSCHVSATWMLEMLERDGSALPRRELVGIFLRHS